MHITSIIILLMINLACSILHERVNTRYDEDVHHEENYGRFKRSIGFERIERTTTPIKSKVVEKLKNEVKFTQEEFVHATTAYGEQAAVLTVFPFNVEEVKGQIVSAMLQIPIRSTRTTVSEEEVPVVVESENGTVLGSETIKLGDNRAIVLLEPDTVDKMIRANANITLNMKAVYGNEQLVMKEGDNDFEESMTPSLQLISKTLDRNRRWGNGHLDDDESSWAPSQTYPHAFQCQKDDHYCCIKSKHFSFKDHEKDYNVIVIAPEQYVSFTCHGDCKDHERELRSPLFNKLKNALDLPTCCTPIKYEPPSQVIWLDGNNALKITIVDRMHVSQCKCL